MSSVRWYSFNNKKNMALFTILVTLCSLCFSKELSKSDLAANLNKIDLNNKKIEDIVNESVWLSNDENNRIISTNKEINSKIKFNMSLNSLKNMGVVDNEELIVLKTLLKAQTGLIKAIEQINKNKECLNRENSDRCLKLFKDTFNNDNIRILNNSIRVNPIYDTIKPLYFDESGN